MPLKIIMPYGSQRNIFFQIDKVQKVRAARCQDRNYTVNHIIRCVVDEYEHQYYGDKLAGNVPYRDIRILLKSRIKPCNAQGVEYNRNAGYGEQCFVLIEPVNGKEQYKKYSVCYCRGDKVYYYKLLCGFCELFAVVANSCARADTVCRYTERSEHGKV